MDRPVIAGYGLVPVGEYWSYDAVSLAVKAIEDLFDRSGLEQIDALYVGNMLSKYYEEQASIASHVADRLGFKKIYALDVENGDASGGYAVMEAIKSILSGEAEYVIAGGVEKSTDGLPGRLYRGVSLSEDIFLVDYIGLTSYVPHAIAAKMYMKRYNISKEEITYLSVLDHDNASKARHAYFRFPIKLETALNSPLVCDPLTLFDISPIVDGAAFLLITRESIAEDMGISYVRILGYGASNNRVRFYERNDPLMLEATSEASNKAFRKSGVSIKDIDFIEIHDSTSIAGLLALEAMGIHPRGSAGKYIKSGVHALDRELPINTFGGLKARGNPLSATTAYGLAEAAMQLLSEAGDNQVRDAKIGLVHGMNNLDLSSVVFILEGVVR